MARTIGLILCLLLVPLQGVAATGNPHGFMDDEDRCGECHLRLPAKAGGFFRRDIVTICRECHVDSHRMSHPVDIRPQDPVPDALPLDHEQTITCATCHDPHSTPFSSTPRIRRGVLDALKGMFSATGYRTYFLRLPTTEGQLCLGCHPAEELERRYLDIPLGIDRDYSGSASCRTCHAGIYREWRKTPHARTLSDPRERPEAVRARFAGDEPFGEEDVVLVIGTHWTQRYVVRRNGELKVARGVWSLSENRWVPSFGREQAWREQCAGCHLTGYDPYLGSYAELGVGCEMCHGPGARHVETGAVRDIINPARLDWRRRSSICASCHTNGHDRTGEFRFAAGFAPGEDLGKYYRGLIAHVGQGEDSFKADGTLEDRLRSYAYWVDNFFQAARITCRLCKSLHVPSGDTGGDPDPGMLNLARHCLSCHGEIHDHPEHAFAGAADVNCHACHQPLADDLGRPSVHDHKFIFVR